jgi:RNA polymerase sigma-70 factor (ECF subfamily)
MITTAAQRILKGRHSDSPPDAFWELLEQFRPELVAQAQAIVCQREDAEDVVQETFIAVSRDHLKLPQKGLRAWLRSVNRANAVDRLRGKKSDSQRLLIRAQQIPEDVFTTGGFSQIEMRDSLKSAMKSLPENLQQVVELRFFKHYSYKQIAQTLNISIGNVSWLLMDASAALYTRLNGHLSPEVAQPPKINEDETQENPPVSQ